MKDYQGALQPAQQSLQESERKEVKDYWELTSLLTIIATCYSHDPKTAPLAIPLLKRAAAVNLRCGEPFAYVRRLQKLAKVYSICGMQQDELKTYEETLKNAVNLYGSRSPALASLYKDYAAAQLQSGDKDGAERSLSKTVVILEKGSSSSPQMKEALERLADVLRQQGRAEEAEEFQSRASRIKLEADGAKQDPLDAIPN